MPSVTESSERRNAEIFHRERIHLSTHSTYSAIPLITNSFPSTCSEKCDNTVIYATALPACENGKMNLEHSGTFFIAVTGVMSQLKFYNLDGYSTNSDAPSAG